MAERPPRPSTDEEQAPLLADSAAAGAAANPSFAERVTSIFQEPLTGLSKLLLALVLLFLLLSSVFIGLFAGAQHKLNTRKDKPAATATVTATATQTSVQTTTVSAPVPTGKPEEKACLTADCIRLSASILATIDTSVDPCDNFYDFANNGWLNDHPLPADKGSFGNFNDLANKNKEVIRAILESTDTPNVVPDYDEQILAKLRGLYSSCTNEDHLNDLGAEPLLNFTRTLRNLLHGKTLTVDSEDAQSTKNISSTGLTAALSFLHSRDVGGLFAFDVDGDAGVDPDNMTLWLSQPELGLPSKEYYQEDSIVAIYTDVVKRLLIALDDGEQSLAPEPVSSPLMTQDEDNTWPPWPWPPWGGDNEDSDSKPVDFDKLAKSVVRFETKLANASLDLDILQLDPIATYNPVPFTNVTDALPQIKFGDYFAAFTPRNFPERVIVTYPAYVPALSQILDETPAGVLEGYLVIRAALTLAPFLGLKTEAWQAQRSLLETLQGIKKGAVGDRSEYCIGRVESSLGFAAGRYFSNVTFGGDSKVEGTRVIENIIKTFKHSLGNIEWMDRKSAKAAAQKADALDVKVGYPTSPNTTDARSIAVYYYLVNIHDDDFFGNMLQASASDVYKKWQRLGKRRDHGEWLMWPSMVNAYYNPPGNEIVFPAGILQPPFFAQGWPGYLAYGAFGMVAAHELTHAFDSSGRLYNQDGKLEEWWTRNTSDAFRVRQNCLASQYSQYYIEDADGNKVYVNGNLTSGENIGDSGIIQAYRAWKAQYGESLQAGAEYVLPGLPYTKDQLFFIAFARVWAQNIKPAAAVQRVRTDPHSPNKYRVDGTLFNVPEFAKAFNCSAKAKLNPPMEKRCLLW